MSAAGPRGTGDPWELLRSRCLRHLESIVQELSYFSEFSGALEQEGFVAAWLDAGSRQHGKDRRGIERCFEQVINDLHEMAQDLEEAAAERRLLPDPRPIAGISRSATARDAWWAFADAIGLDVADADRSHAPGRWRRLAYLGVLGHDVATDLRDASNVRQLLQHGYAHRSRERAVEVWQTMQDAIEVVPDLLRAFEGLLARIIEPPEGTAQD